jgi:tRNA(His) 5'-end guanylyltransferase
VKLKERISSYEGIADTRLLNKLPLIITVNGRSFNKVSSILDKPFSKEFAEAMYSAMYKASLEIEGCIFSYCYNDIITFAIRNDQSADTLPWYDNKIQKISSITSSLVTLYFNNYSDSVDMNLMGDALFISSVYAVPNITEAINVFVYKQQEATQFSVQSACFYEFIKKYNKNEIKEMLNGASIDDKINLLKQECNIDFNDYPVAFKRGVACYKGPKIVEYEGESILKNKWLLNSQLPIFTSDQTFLKNIFYSGNDIVRNDI